MNELKLDFILIFVNQRVWKAWKVLLAAFKEQRHFSNFAGTGSIFCYRFSKFSYRYRLFRAKSAEYLRKQLYPIGYLNLATSLRQLAEYVDS